MSDQGWRSLFFQVSAATSEGDRWFVAGRCGGEPLPVGDRFHRTRPPGDPLAAGRPCSLVIESILWRGVYVTWSHEGILPLELELSGEPPEGRLVGVELCGESKEPLLAFEALGRGERRTRGD
jgi:hypothetical protein